MRLYFRENHDLFLIFIRIIFLYYLSLFELLRLAWLKISRSSIRIIKHTNSSFWQFSYPLLHTCKLCHYGGGAAAREKFCSGKHIPKIISIGNVRITNRRYNTRVHCACQESRNYIHLQTMKSRFLAIRYLPLAKLFSWSIFYTIDILCKALWNDNNEIHEMWHICVNRYNSKIYLKSYFSYSKISLIGRTTFILSRSSLLQIILLYNIFLTHVDESNRRLN